MLALAMPMTNNAQNLLENPDFDATSDPWRIQVNSPGNAYGVWSANQGSPTAGSFAAAAMFPGDLVFAWQCLEPPTGPVDFSARTKSVYAERDAVYVQMMAFDVPGCMATAIEVVAASQYYELDDGWREYRKAAHTVPESTQSIALFLTAAVGSASNLTYFDHAIVAPTGAIVLDRIFQSDFEE